MVNHSLRVMRTLLVAGLAGILVLGVFGPIPPDSCMQTPVNIPGPPVPPGSPTALGLNPPIPIELVALSLTSSAPNQAFIRFCNISAAPVDPAPTNGVVITFR